MMKKLLATITLLAAQSALAFECNFYEAQFIGTVSSLTVTDAAQDICVITLDFNLAEGNQFHSHILCPLYIGEVSNLPIQVNSCSMRGLEVGEVTSGYLLKPAGENSLILE